MKLRRQKFASYFFFEKIFAKIFQKFVADVLRRHLSYEEVRSMNDSFIDAVISESINMLKKACNGEELSKEELNFIILAQKLSAQREKKQAIPNLIKSTSGILPLLTSFLGGS